MVYSRKKNEWESGVEYDKLDLMKGSDLIGCWAVLISICILVWAVWHFLFSDIRFPVTVYVIIALIFIVSVSFVIAQLRQECEDFYVDYEGIHLHTFYWNSKLDMGQMQTYKWENIRNIEFKYVHYANDEYTNEGDPYATYKIIIETDSGQKIDRLLRDSLSDVKIICKKYYGSPHRWFE